MLQAAQSIGWNEYKSLCDSPATLSRWMLEQSLELLHDEPRLVEALERVLSRSPLAKPVDHRGGSASDMFELDFDVGVARRVHAEIVAAVSHRRTTSATHQRGLGGFEEAWREYLNFVERKERGVVMSNASTVVRSLIAAFNASDLDRIASHFASDAVYHNMPVAPVSGVGAIREVLSGFMGLATQVDWQLHQIAEAGAGVVLTERTDRFLINGKWIGLPVMGTFEVADGKITAWRDYFDMNQFQSQLAG